MTRLITITILLLCSCNPGDACDDQASTGPTPNDVPTESMVDPVCDADCCEDFGSMEDRPGLCALSEFPYCYGCDGKPALCMTHGCATPYAEDCCLSAEGQTIAGPKSINGTCV